jgi:arsenate reductase-like glutaredoxin family protein
VAKQWFEKLGFKKYPLDSRSNPDLVGVEEIEKNLLSYISQGNMCLLCGLTGTGKTSMIQRMMQRQELSAFETLYVSADGLKKDKDILDLVKEKMSILDRILFKKPKNLVIFLDECQLATRQLTESIKSKWNETYGSGDKVIHSVVVCQIDSRLQSNFSGSFMDRLGKRMVRMRKLKTDELKEILNIRLNIGKKNYIEKFSPDGLTFLVKNCDGSVRQLLEYADTIFRELDKLDETSLKDDSFKITKDHVFTLLQSSGLVVSDKNYLKKKVHFKKVFSSERLKKAVEMFEEFGVMNVVLLAEKLDVPKARAQVAIRNLLKEDAIMVSHTEDREKFYVLTPRMKHELVSE